MASTSGIGNLYHLNAEEEPEQLDYPGQKNPAHVPAKARCGAARRAAHLGHGRGRPDGGPEVRPRRQAEDREHRQAHPQAHGDRSTAKSLAETLKWLDKHGKGDKPFFCWFNTTAIHIRSHSRAEVHPDGRGRRPPRGRRGPRQDDRARRTGRLAAQEARGPRRRRQHHRHLHHRQRQRADALAGRRLCAVPRREGHHLGRRRARPDAREVARQDQARHACPTASRTTRISSPPSRRRRACRTSRRNCSPARRWAT